MNDTSVIIHTDGACSGNPGPGGWGALLAWRDATKEMKGGAADTTNNRMEMTAAIEALESLKRPSKVELYTDSTYVRDGITSWIARWKSNGWRTAAKKPVKNVDLWQRLEAALARHGHYLALGQRPRRGPGQRARGRLGPRRHGTVQIEQRPLERILLHDSQGVSFRLEGPLVSRAVPAWFPRWFRQSPLRRY